MYRKVSSYQRFRTNQPHNLSSTPMKPGVVNVDNVNLSDSSTIGTAKHSLCKPLNMSASMFQDKMDVQLRECGRLRGTMFLAAQSYVVEHQVSKHVPDYKSFVKNQHRYSSIVQMIEDYCYPRLPFYYLSWDDYKFLGQYSKGVDQFDGEHGVGVKIKPYRNRESVLSCINARYPDLNLTKIERVCEQNGSDLEYWKKETFKKDDFCVFDSRLIRDGTRFLRKRPEILDFPRWDLTIASQN